MESGVRMEKHTGVLERFFSGRSVTKTVAALLIVLAVLYALTQCVLNGLWFVALGVAALALCTALSVLLLCFGQKLARRKAFDITVDTSRQ